MNDKYSNILVIKLGALGDFILCTGPFKAIREHHKNSKITLLTTSSFASIAKETGWFDKIHIDNKPKAFNFIEWLKIRKFFNQKKWSRIYDFQHNDRTSIYFRFLNNPKPEWSGIEKNCSHRHTNPMRDKLHTIERQIEQLNIAGITDVPKIDISWLKEDINLFNLPKKYALIVPGGSSHRKNKRWPEREYIKLSEYLLEKDIIPVLIGTKNEQDVTNEISSASEKIVNLNDKTSIGQIASMGRNAIISIGNDTGPMHIIAATGCPTLVIFSRESRPSETAPRGEQTQIIQSNNIEKLFFENILGNIEKLLV
ncbi:MAG: ADP-heptose--LPS heptosyltransferase [Rhodospirillaceae bacterium]|nr:ADP-heptose--LPS heptosyltransferase [Rhodospirillaceae bacterium]|tara:strand:- start:195 stop:1130 length:936 start_codon:yes stop_codon:yes gene_type:complete